MRNFGLKAAFCCIPLVILLQPILPTTAATRSTTCHIKVFGEHRTGPKVSVSINEPANTQLKIGMPIKISWSLDSPLQSGCHTPIYLIFTMPERVRFKGEGFLILPPKAVGPYGLRLGSDLMRAIVPLHVGEALRSGTIEVKSYSAGPFLISWTLVEIPKKISHPINADDFTRGAWIDLPSSRGSSLLTIAQAPPEVVIQDRYLTETPKRTIVSPTGEFEIRDYGDFYRVLERPTNNIVVERAGVQPGFSPTSRFVYAFGGPSPGVAFDQRQFEVFDLYSGTIAFEQRPEDNEAAGMFVIQSVKWALNDEYMSLGFAMSSGVSIENMLVERDSIYQGKGCMECGSVGTATLQIDLDNAISIYAVSNPIQKLPLEGLTDSLLFSQSALNQLAAHRQFSALRKIDTDIAKLTNRTLSDDERAKMTALMEQQSELYDQEEELGRQWIAKTHFLAKPTLGTTVALSPAKNWTTSGRVINNFQEDEPAKATAKIKGKERPESLGLMPGNKYARDRLSQRLAHWGIRPQAMATPDILVRPQPKSPETEEWPGDFNWFLDSFKTDAPEMAAVFGAEHLRGCMIEENDRGIWEGGESRTPVTDELTPASIDGSTVYSVYSWKMATQRIWLVATMCSYSDLHRRYGQLVLIAKAPGKPAELFWLSLKSFGDETVGVGLGMPNRPKLIAQIIDRHILLLAAEDGRDLFVFDITTRQITHRLDSDSQHDAIQGLYATDDGRLVQLNQAGGLAIYSLEQNRRLVKGRFIDDEIIFYDSNGFYAGTEEAANYVYLKFPGLPGYFSLHQFRVALNQPDQIAALLSGEMRTLAPPSLTVPPTADLTVTPISQTNDSQKLQLKITARAPSGLNSVRVYLDGRLEYELKSSGSRKDFKVDLDAPLTLRWITIEAVDARLYESIPVSVPMPRPSPASVGVARLFGLAIGTDHYIDEEHLGELKFAQADAKIFTGLIKSVGEGYYKELHAEEPLLDATGLNKSLPEKIKAIVKASRSEDTIMLFISGHGIMDHGRLYLATIDTKLDDLTHTAVAWDDIVTALTKSTARVVVFLDTCHSGAAAGNESTNDDAVVALTKGNAPILVLAASKGAQNSQDGVFTPVLVDLVNRRRDLIDLNKNGAIELSELYGALKQRVVDLTNGRQTPWISRNDMIGEIPLF